MSAEYLRKRPSARPRRPQAGRTGAETRSRRAAPAVTRRAASDRASSNRTASHRAAPVKRDTKRTSAVRNRYARKNETRRNETQRSTAQRSAARRDTRTASAPAKNRTATRRTPTERSVSRVRARRRRIRRARLLRRVLPGILLLALLALGARWAARSLFPQELKTRTLEQTIYLPPLILPSLEEEDEEGESLLLSVPEPDGVEAVTADASGAHWERKDGFFTLLLAGADKGYGGSDTIILASIDTVEKKMNGVSIPRDTKAIVNGKAHKINAAYKAGGMNLLASTISSQLGIPIDATIEVDLAGFSSLVDAIGGVDFEVPVDMNYDDEKQDLYIHIAKGFQHLDGENALKVVRFRHNNDGSGYGSEDYGRIATQQQFLKTVAKKLLSPSSLWNLNDLVKIFQESVKTEMSFSNLLWLGNAAISIGTEGIEFSTLPGNWKSPYVYTDPAAALELINARLNPYVEERRMEDLNIPS